MLELPRPLRVGLLGVAIAGAAVLAGCPSSRCARTVSTRCVELVCPKGASPKHGQCECEEGSTTVLGACVGFELADAFCGADARIQPGGACAPKVCEPGRALELESGLCLPAARTLAAMSGGVGGDEPPTDQRAACTFGTLVARAGHPTCLVGELSCGRGQLFQRDLDAGAARPGLPAGGVCVAAKACDAGEIFDEVSGQCVRVLRASGSDRIVDVGAWARLALGIDGGEGTRALCAPVRAVQGEGAGPATFSLRLSFPDNDVTQVSGRIQAQQAPAVVLDAAERSLAQVLETLRQLGGMATAGSVSADVTCSAPQTSFPSAEALPPDAGISDAGK